MIEKLVTFDWSGTLSPDAVRFGEDDNLKRELKRSGLASLGVAGPEAFWREIVNPTWEEGSTTPTGYGEIISRRIEEVFSPAVSDDQIRLSAARFVDSYLTHSPIDGRWRSILGKLGNDPSVITVIATDHYAEATGYVVRHLGEMGAHARPLKNVSCQAVSFIVANSADVGARKADRAFWEALRDSLQLDALRSVLIVDDFGFNEGVGDSYADRRKVEDRKGATLSLLEGVFGVPVSLVSFMWERGGNSEKDEKVLGDLIARASGEIEGYLSER
ncbi:MAG: hypothetical protein JXI32_01200 [Deltaproteobacteria bacterium]|nr:hypothetical protein [Deltaproteobacteria bacterium]